jgi:hypothetical protein
LNAGALEMILQRYAYKTDVYVLGFTAIGSRQQGSLVLAINLFYQIAQIAHTPQGIRKLAEMHTDSKVIPLPN